MLSMSIMKSCQKHDRVSTNHANLRGIGLRYLIFILVFCHRTSHIKEQFYGLVKGVIVPTRKHACRGHFGVVARLENVYRSNVQRY